MITLTYLRTLDGFTGEARLYRVTGDPGELVRYQDENDEACVTAYVIVSATTVAGTPETYIYPSSNDGQILSWTELAGSFKGALDHDQAIAGAGWALSEPLAEEAALATTLIGGAS